MNSSSQVVPFVCQLCGVPARPMLKSEVFYLSTISIRSVADLPLFSMPGAVFHAILQTAGFPSDPAMHGS